MHRRFLLLCWLVFGCLAFSQTAVDRLAPGRLLVAEEQVLDPRFARTVVLLVDYGPDGAMGLIINRPARLTLAEALPRLETLEGRTDRIYFGGPVEPKGLLMLLRSEEPPEGFETVLNGVHLGGGASKMAQLLVKGVREDRIRGYAGYAGWGPGQLDGEVRRGDWSIAPAAAGQVFDPAPETLWKKLIERSKIRFARAW